MKIKCWISFTSCVLLLPLSTQARQTVTTPGGTVNAVAKYSSATTIVNSALFETGGRVGIGTTAPASFLDIRGSGARTTTPNLVIGSITDTSHGLSNFTTGVASGLSLVLQTGNFGSIAFTPNGGATYPFFVNNNGQAYFAGNLGIGTTAPGSKLTVVGTIQSTSGGFRFPDGSVQTSAAGSGSTNVQHYGTLFGNGTGASPLGVAVPLVLSANSADGIIQGLNTGGGSGVYGKSVSGFGVYGESSIAVAGNSSNNIGLYGSGPYAGVSSYGGIYGVLSTAYATSGTADGVHATGANGIYAVSNRAGGNGILAIANNGNSSDYAVWGQSSSGYAGVFSGNVSVFGTLTKSAGTFKIDHPLDPENKYLSHSFVESPDMMNIYNGNSELDGNGQAIVQLPSYFNALNKEYRYQLTAMGAPGPNLYIAQEIVANQFVIAGGKAGMKVSWQVTGIRQDVYANAHRTPVEEAKAEKERGTYLHPELYGQSEEKGREWAIHPETMQRIKEATPRQAGNQN